jgi:hypothetical protein
MLTGAVGNGWYVHLLANVLAGGFVVCNTTLFGLVAVCGKGGRSAMVSIGKRFLAKSSQVMISEPQKWETLLGKFSWEIPVSRCLAKSSARVGQPHWSAVTLTDFPAFSWACILV